MDTAGNNGVASKVVACQKKLLSFVTATKSPASDLVDHREVENIQERFDQWAGNLGAFHLPQSRLSLEYRLRHNPQVRKLIEGLLDDLFSSVKSALDILLGQKENRTAAPLIGVENDLAEFYISSDSDSSNYSSPDGNAAATLPTSEIEELILAIRSSIENLFKSSILIRKFAPNDRRQAAAKTTERFSSLADEMYIRDRFPLVEKKERSDLVIRLGLANAQRRQYFKYRQDHNDRLSTPDAGHFIPMQKHRMLHSQHAADEYSSQGRSLQPGHIQPSIFTETEATEIRADSLAQTILFAFFKEMPTPSVISDASENIKFSEDHLTFPSLPLDAQKNSSFLCPYCMRAVHFLSRHKAQQWSLDTYHSQHAWFEHELLMHRSDWNCSECGAVFESAEDLESHINKKHDDKIMPKQTPGVVKQSKRPRKSIKPSECPFCEDAWVTADPVSGMAGKEAVVVTSDDFRSHLGHHLQQLALFALPRLDQGQSAGSDDVIEDDPDREALSAGHKWVRDDCGYGWSLVAARRCTFITFAWFLRKLNPEKFRSGPIPSMHNSPSGGLESDDAVKDQDVFKLSELPHRLLADEITESLEPSTFPIGSVDHYMPEGHLERFITTDSIVREFSRGWDPRQGDHSVDPALIQFILESAKKVFAIILLSGIMSKDLRITMESLKSFDFKDIHLPIHNEDMETLSWSRNVRPAWAVANKKDFERKQWMFLAPVFLKNHLKMEIDSPSILPFALVSGKRRQGTFSDVWEVAIHEFHQEEPMRKWADGGNLRDLYTSNPRPILEADFVRAIIQQLTGLAGALHALHEYKKDETDGASYRHGNLKPENILRFNDGSQVGVLKLCDMGWEKHHPENLYERLLYEPPEVILNTRAAGSQRRDMWSIG
ncbi:hypothetical protein Daus18300_001390 [Diaporthe australafricana]|uniref:Protein kinase domain-containing protein n=1 Tax=Diaporthe australafricana TaxID=127596 RepID=A0ABR3XWM3_9PEZI